MIARASADFVTKWRTNNKYDWLRLVWNHSTYLLFVRHFFTDCRDITENNLAIMNYTWGEVEPEVNPLMIKGGAVIS